MREYKTIVGQLAFSYLNKIITVLASFLLFVILTRFLSKGDYGVVSLFFVTISLLATYLNLGLSVYVVKEFAGLKEKLRQKKLSSLFSFQFLTQILITLRDQDIASNTVKVALMIIVTIINGDPCDFRSTCGVLNHFNASMISSLSSTIKS